MIGALTPEEREAIGLSLRVALVATAGGLPPAVLVAWALARGRFPGRLVLDALVHLPLVLPPVVTGYALLVLFGRQGWLGAPLREVLGVTLAFRWTGAALAAAVMAFPLMVRPLRQGFEALDPALAEAAALDGAGRWQRFARVTLPLAFPAVVAAAVLGFAKALGEFGATITFVASIPGETRTVPAAIYGALQVPGGEAAALRLCLASALVAVAALAASEALLARGRRRLVG